MATTHQNQPTTHHDDEMPSARSLEEAVNADNSLEGYAAMNYDDNAEISQRAYQLYEERGRQHGFHEQDWHQAEQEIRSRGSRTSEPAAAEPIKSTKAGAASHSAA